MPRTQGLPRLPVTGGPTCCDQTLSTWRSLLVLPGTSHVLAARCLYPSACLSVYPFINPSAIYPSSGWWAHPQEAHACFLGSPGWSTLACPDKRCTEAGGRFQARRRSPAEQALGRSWGKVWASFPFHLFSVQTSAAALFPASAADCLRRACSVGCGLRTAASHAGVALQSQWRSSVTPCTLAPRTRTRPSLLASWKGT